MARSGETLRVYNWSDYIGEETIRRFEAETGIDVHYGTYDSSEQLESALMKDMAGFDVVVPTSDYLGRTLRTGRFMPLDRALIPNWDQLDPAQMAAAEAFDPGNRHAAIYLWGTTGIGYNPAMVREHLGADAPLDSWALLLDPENAAKLADCGITMLDSGVEVLPPVMNYLGYPPGTDDPEALAAAAAAIAAIKPHVRNFYTTEYIDDLASGEVCVSMGWSGDVFIAQDRADESGLGVEIVYSIPKEGTVLWFDMLAIPADAPNPEAAHAFINFVLQPEIMAGITNHVYYPNAVPASLPFVSPEIRDDPEIYPPPDVRANLFPSGPYGVRTQRMMTRLWDELRAGD